MVAMVVMVVFLVGYMYIGHKVSVFRNKLKLSLGGMNLLKVKQFIGKISGMIQTNEYTVKRKIIPLRIRTLIESDHNYHYDHLSMNFSHEIMVV